VNVRLASTLLRDGFDVVTVHEVSLRATDDSLILEWAARQHRAVVSINVGDFEPLHKQWLADGREHYSIIISTEESLSTVIARSRKLLTLVDAADLRNRLVWLNDFR